MTWLDPHPILLTLGPLSLATHGVFFALGAEVALLVAARRQEEMRLSREEIFRGGFLIFAVGLLAARVGYFLTYPSQFQSVGQLLAIWEGGLVSFFGILGGLLAAWRLFPEKTWRWQRLDVLAVSTLAAWGVGRIGNYYAADSVGVKSALWSNFYGRVPIQLFESVACLVLAWWLYRQIGQKKPGTVFWMAWLGYFFARFHIDFWREEGWLAGLHVSQWVCLGLVIGGLFGYLARRHEKT